MIARRALLSSAAFPLLALAAPRRLHPGSKPSPAAARGEAAPSAEGPAQTPLGPYDTVARWAIVTDFDTGATLLAKAADQPMPPSSMTKLMTAYVVYSMLKAGRLRLDGTLPVSERAWRMQGSKMFVPLGGQVKVEDLIRGMIIQSGNDACIVLAEGIAGSEEGFAALMNEQAKRLGLTASHFVNATGWPDPAHAMSARDIAALAAAIIRDFPEYYKYDSEKSFTYDGISQENRNILVQKGLADGLKTGHTDAGGFGIVISAARPQADGRARRVIVVLNGMTSMHQRAEEGERVLEWAFREWENARLFVAGEAVDRAPVYLGRSFTVGLASPRDVVVTMPRGWRNSAKLAVRFDGPIPAPVRRGEAIGEASFTGPGVPAMAIPLVAAEDVPRLPLAERAAAALRRLVVGA